MLKPTRVRDLATGGVQRRRVRHVHELAGEHGLGADDLDDDFVADILVGQRLLQLDHDFGH
jgi:hypothetical protein